MVAKRMASLLGLALLLLAGPAAAEELAYGQELAGSSNNIVELNAAMCNGVDGCYEKGGLPCPTGEQCNYQVVPAGRCGAGNGPCAWPNGAGSCVDNPLVACIPDAPNQGAMGGTFPSAMCANIPDSNPGDGIPAGQCNATGNDPSCGCQGNDPTALDFEAFVCDATGTDAQARCSDGDPALEFGGDNPALCTIIQLGPPGMQPPLAPNCGGTSFLAGNFIGPKFNYENPPQVNTPQRLPGTGLSPAFSPIINTQTTAALDVDTMGTGSYSQHGLRSVRVLSDSWHTDWQFTAQAATGGLDANIIVYYCDPPLGWKTNLPVSGECAPPDAGVFCIEDSDCPNSFCDPSTFEYCHEAGDRGPRNGVGWMWTRDLSAAEASAQTTCPPNCGSAASYHTGENEALEDVMATNPRAGVQLAFDTLVGLPQGKGGVNLVQPLTAITWLGPDARCFIGGNPDVINSTCDPGTLTCGDGITPCNPGVPNDCANKKGICTDGSGASCNLSVGGAAQCNAGQACVPCGGTLVGGTCSNDASVCSSNGDCSGGGTCNTPVPCVDCDFVDPIKGNANATPVGYNDHGFAELGLLGRIGGVADRESNVRTPILLVQTNNVQTAEFRDDTCVGLDTCVLGQDAGPLAAGIGTGGSFAASFVPPVDPTGGPLGQMISWGPETAGGPGGIPFLTLNDYGPGADRIPGCLGDNSTLGGNTPCDDIFGTGGSTGADDVPLMGDFGSMGAPLLQPAVIARFQVSDPTARAPVFNVSGATTIRDLDVILVDNSDVMVKNWTTWCPFRGTCTGGGGERCVDDSDCPGAETCGGLREIDCTRESFCSERGGDTDGDGFCNDDDPCDAFANVPNGNGMFPDTNSDGVPNACQCGDANGDGNLSFLDALNIVQTVQGVAAVPAPPNRADTNGDGNLSFLDALRVVQTVQGVIPNAYTLTCPVRPEGSAP